MPKQNSKDLWIVIASQAELELLEEIVKSDSRKPLRMINTEKLAIKIGVSKRYMNSLVRRLVDIGILCK